MHRENNFIGRHQEFIENQAPQPSEQMETVRLCKEEAQRVSRDTPSEEELRQEVREADFIGRVQQLSAADAVIASAGILRNPQLQGVLGKDLVTICSDKVIHTLDTVPNDFVEKTMHLPMPELLDVIHQLKTIGLRVIGQISAEVETEAYQKMVDVFSEIEAGQNIPFVSYACDDAKNFLREKYTQRMQSRMDNPSTWTEAFIWNDPSDAREEEEHGQWQREDSSLRKKIDAPTQLLNFPLSEPRVLIHRIAKDAIGVFDHTLTPQQYGIAHFPRPAKTLAFHEFSDIGSEKNLVPFEIASREECHLLLQHLHRPSMRRAIENDLGISLNTISLRSQIHLLRFLAGEDRSVFERMRACIKDHPRLAAPFLESFLASAEDSKFGESILSIIERYPEETSARIFSAYQEVARASERVAEYAAASFGGTITGKSLVQHKMNQDLLRRGRDLLANFDADTSQKNRDHLVDQLKSVKADFLLFTSLLKTVKDDETLDVSLQEIAGVSLESYSGGELSASDSEAMRILYENSYRNNTKEYKDDFIDELISGFDEAVQSPKSTFYLLRYEGQIIAFRRFDEIGKNHYYTASLNVDPVFSEKGVGVAFVEETGKPYSAKGATLECDMDLRQPLWERRIREGYLGVGYEPSHKGVPGIRLRLDAGERSRFVTVSKSDKELLALISAPDESGRILAVADSGYASLHLISEGYVLTRIISDNNHRVLIYEAARGIERKKQDQTTPPGVASQR